MNGLNYIYLIYVLPGIPTHINKIHHYLIIRHQPKKILFIIFWINFIYLFFSNAVPSVRPALISQLYYCKNLLVGLFHHFQFQINSAKQMNFSKFIYSFIFYFYFILLYNTVLILPYIDMNPPRVYKL